MKQIWLIVEDDPIIRSILTALMTLWGVDSIVFRDGHEAAKWLDAVERADPSVQLPDIALMDMRIPGLSGPEIGKRMRSHPVTRNIPIVIMSAYQLTREERNEVMELARPEAIIGKPLPAPDDLRTMLDRTIQAARQKNAVRLLALIPRNPQYRYLVDEATSRRIAAMQAAKRRRSRGATVDANRIVAVPVGVRAAFARSGTKPLNPSLSA